MQGKNITQNGLVLHLDSGNPQSFDGNSTIWRDLSNTTTGCTLFNGVGYSNNNRGVMTFDGVNEFGKITSTIYNRVGSDQLTIQCWIYPQRNAGRYQDIIINRPTGGNFNWMLYQHTNGGEISFHGNNQYKSTYIPILNQWVNITVVVDNFTYKLYANSVVVFSSVYAYNGSYPGTLSIGCIPDGNEPWLGQIPIVQVYNRALSQEEITQNYNATKDRFNTIVYNGLVLNLDASNSLSYDGTTTWRDLSGNNNHGTLVNGVGYNSSNSGTLTFDGTDDYINVSSGINSIIKGSTFPFSISFWCYCNDSGTRDVFFGDFIGSPTNCFNIERNSGTITNNSLRFYWGGNPDYYANLFIIPQNTWVNVCISYNGSNISFYKNGVLVNVNTIVLPLYTKSSGNYQIGKDSRDGTTALNGNIPSVQLYNRALTQDEITQNYNATKSKFGL